MLSLPHRTSQPSTSRIARNVLLGLPVVIGGVMAVVLGAWDYMPWLSSPAVWLGVLVSVVAGARLVQTRSATPRDVIEGVVLGLVLFGLAVVAVFAAIVLFWVVWNPIG